MSYPMHIGILARMLHEQGRERVVSWPAWEDLDITDPYEAELIRSAYDRARDFVAMNSRDEE